jgi:thiamine pyrophosphokinase
MKCIELARSQEKQNSASNNVNSDDEKLEQKLRSNLSIVTLAGTGGRFDQSMSLIHHLFVLNYERRATLVSDDSIIVALGPVSFY